MNDMGPLWFLWVLSFVLLEGYALASKRKGDTFTEHFRKWFRVGDPNIPTWATWAIRIPLLGFGIWLTGHLALGWWG